jgi:hypothetical protein
VGGNTAKARLDRVVDACGAVENLREVILERRQMMVRDLDMEHTERTNVADKNHAMKMCVEILERYLTLIMFTAWLGSDARRLTTSFTQVRAEIRAWVTPRARWVTRRARWMTLRARWVTLRARLVTLTARWVTL